ncbi:MULTISPECIES: tRNA-intron lyase [Halobacterium]|uniref:tRNA-intron lyase n=1 Tax=Halobacterium TaxID=2239 RepID=UPI0019632F3B|nr:MULTISPECIES: tRNA-intron lyase [Halobacterium]MCF2164484.1 tRNA-intron lyase [Halobacterium salinarum]MCF2167271.1 tRNA-intron lyase [Halobacterium salinarum]MCF2206259.1 tRNA-intron lyase [Halobacterium salinarum]MCF2238334.1 tRNA-intron lyase [Halobacterium salinarum]MDL0123367.1 tRNA-intron lyase [Halobacterium salinarum]
MDGDLRGDTVHIGGDARQRFHDARGYGYPLGGNDIAVSLVEAAHLLFRGDLDSVDGMGFRAFLTDREAGFAARFLVYVDLRDRGFYLVPDRDPWWRDPGDGDFVVFPRGNTRRDGVVKHRVRVVDERTTLPVDGLSESVLAVVDEESEITYLDIAPETPTGETTLDRPTDVPGVLLDDRVLVWEPPQRLHNAGFYGQPLGGRAADHDALQLSLVEAAYLIDAGVLTLTDATIDDVRARGRLGEGEHFDCRLAVYRALRDAGAVPKTGFKFGADFRVYSAVSSVDDLGHSELLVRVITDTHVFSPGDLSLDVRLAHGVRKRMVFAATDDTDDTIRWLSVSRLTP